MSEKLPEVGEFWEWRKTKKRFRIAYVRKSPSHCCIEYHVDGLSVWRIDALIDMTTYLPWCKSFDDVEPPKPEMYPIWDDVRGITDVLTGRPLLVCRFDAEGQGETFYADGMDSFKFGSGKVEKPISSEEALSLLCARKPTDPKPEMEMVVFHEVACKGSGLYKELRWVDKVQSFHTPTGRTETRELPKR